MNDTPDAMPVTEPLVAEPSSLPPNLTYTQRARLQRAITRQLRKGSGRAPTKGAFGRSRFWGARPEPEQHKDDPSVETSATTP